MDFTPNKRNTGLCAALLLCSFLTRAQTNYLDKSDLSLEQVWLLADSNSKKIQMQRLDAQAGAARIKAAQSERLPELAANGVLAHVFDLPVYENGLFHTPSQYPVDPKYYKVGAELYLNLYNGGKTNREITASEKEHEIDLAKTQLTTQEIHYTAAVYFYDVYRNESYRELLLQDIKDREAQLKEIEQLYKNGTILKSDVLRAELRLSKQRMLLVEIENNIRISTHKLNLLIGKETEAPIRTVVPESEMKIQLLKPANDFIKDATHHSFKLAISEKEQELNALHLKQVKSNALPSLGFFAEYAYAYPQIQFYPYSLSLYSNGMAGLKLKIPISSWYTNQHKVKEAAIQLKRQLVEDEEVKDQIFQEVNEYYIRYNESVKKIAVAEENIRQATESYRIVQNTYFNQLALLTDLLDAETQLLQSKFELTTAKVNARIQYYQLQKAVGNL